MGFFDFLFGKKKEAATAPAAPATGAEAPRVTNVCVGESLVGEGNEVAHIDLIIGPRGSSVEKAATQAVQMFGPAQRAVAMAIADSVEDGTLRADQADDLFICVGVFIHWLATDDTKIQDYNYRATKEALARAVNGSPKAKEVVAQKKTAMHPFQAAAA